ncbi:hypothetical protein DWB77_07520 [Streptomyces hundungensis]|uniref:Transposase IS701-like DDE domain-containing protein n=1 Tax=Streptomyces hundungensis TaxID=1077946 RepID=A0A387HR06_9ACTN|nr:hypothetical protein DWB77_07520 [Streptomyces hundungensis]
MCTAGPARTLVDLALAPEHRRGHGALYSGINHGRIDVARLRRALANVPLPRAGDGRLVLAVDVSPWLRWLRPDADTSSDRSFCHTFGRGLGKHRMVPGWPYSIVAALETGRTSWTALLDAIRLEPGADLAAVTADQVREVVQRLVDAGQWRDGDPKVLVVLDAGYDGPRIAHLLADLPVEVLGRLRSDRVMRKPVPVPWICPPQGGRPPKHGGEFVFGRPGTWGDPDVLTLTDTDRYGTATAQAWDRLHPRLTRRAAWGDHEGPLPIIEGTVIRLSVEKLPSGGVNKPVWLWWSGTGADPHDIDRCWQAFLRRFDVEHTFRLLKQTLSAGPGPNCGTRRPPTAGHGSSWPRTLSSASPAYTGSASALGAAGGTEQTHPCPSPPRVQEPAGEDGHASQCTKTHQARPRPSTRIEEPADRHPLRRRTSPRHRRGIQPPRTPPEGDEAATNGLSCKSGASVQPSLAGSPHDVMQKGPCRVDGPGVSAPSSGRGTGLPPIAGLSPPALAEVARVERNRNYLWPGVTAESVRIRRGFVRDPYRNLWSEYEDGGCGVWECCGSPFEAREFLDAVIHGMSRRRARELRFLVDQLDNSY